MSFYVYALLDKDGIPFYIGKGQGRRCYVHFPVYEKWETNKRKVEKIKETVASTGKPPQIIFLHNNVEDEHEAYCLEAGEIAYYRTLTDLTNIRDGGVLPNENGFNFASKTCMSESEIKAKNNKTAETTKSRGLLRGANHPLFGKGHSAAAKEKIRANHADVAGKCNPNAKTWELISPQGEIFVVVGELRKFCKQYSLSYSILIRNADNGKVLEVRGSTTLCLNTLNWEIKRR